MHTNAERHSLVDELLHGIDAAVANLDSAITELSHVAAPGRAFLLLAGRARLVDPTRCTATPHRTTTPPP